MSEPGKDYESDSGGCFKIFGIVLIVIGVLASLTGAGAVIGLPAVGFGSLFMLFTRLGVGVMTDDKSAKGCLFAIVAIVVIVFLFLLANW